MFNRLLIIRKSGDIDLKELILYGLSPMSFGTTDETPCKTVKAKLVHELEKDVKPHHAQYICSNNLHTFTRPNAYVNPMQMSQGGIRL